MPLSRTDRLAEFVQRLQAAQRARSFDEAYGQIFRFLNEGADELSGIPYNPLAEKLDGRLYPPLWDNIVELKGRKDIKRLRSLRHVTVCSKAGEDGVEWVSYEKASAARNLHSKTLSSFEY